MSAALEQLISEILSGDALTLSQAARKLVPHRGNSVAPSTIWRWHRTGVDAPNGQRVHLELARVGSKWLTSAAALARFIDRQTPNLNSDSASAPRTPRQRERAAERAGAQLDLLLKTQLD